MKAMLIHIPNIHEHDPEKAKALLARMCERFTHSKVAAELGVSARTVYGYIYGTRKIRYPTQYMLETLEKVM